MARRVHYRILADRGTTSEEEWEEIVRLEHWYNSEFAWSDGMLSLRRYVVFPNDEVRIGERSAPERVRTRDAMLKVEGLREEDRIRTMEKEGLIIVRWGGYADNSFASGFTRVANNEWNAYLACDFMLKASTLAHGAWMEVVDEGTFVRPGCVWFHDGSAYVDASGGRMPVFVDEMLADRTVFALVDRNRYDRHRGFRNTLPGFNRMNKDQRVTWVKDWNWLGYAQESEVDFDHPGAVDLNVKVRSFGAV